MEETDFYITNLDGQKIGVTYKEVYGIRRDVLIYFDENMGEPVNIIVPEEEFKLDYWKYLSIKFDKEWAESEGYKKVIEEGCLALLNGIALDILDEPIGIIKREWRGVKVENILPYIQAYQPENDRLHKAKKYLLNVFHFIENFTEKDLDESNLLKEFDTSLIGKWFDENIVEEYFRWRLKKYKNL